MKNTLISLLYFLTGILFLIFKQYPSFLAAFILKTLIIPVLMVLFLTNLRTAENLLNKLILAGLIFSWAGDVLLEVPEGAAGLFIPGLVCFLLAHIMYLSVFFLTSGENFILRRGIFFIVPLVIYGTGLVYYLYNGLGDMRMPVILYTAVILTMLAGAINRLKKVNRASYWLVLAGAILFVVSDSAIAVDKFWHHFSGSEIMVMLTYISAQYLIVTGYIRQAAGRRQAGI
jgi:uncharacterized membrane protein YhhN